MTRVTNRDTEILVDLASDLMDAGEWQQARAVTQQLVEIDPEDPRHHCALGIALLHLDELGGAEQCLRTALDKGGENAHVLLLMARLYNRRGDPGGQLEWAQRAAKCDGNNAEAQLAVADAQVRLGQLTEAEKVLRNMSAANPGNIQAHRMLGNICLSLQKIDDAGREFQAALENEPSDAALWTSLGHTLERTGKHEEAIVAFQRASLLQPANAQYAYHVGDAYLALEQPGMAIGYLTKAVQLDPDLAMGYYDLGLAFFAQRKYEWSAIASAAALRSDPEMKTQRINLGIGATGNLGLAYLNLGKHQEAEACFRRNLKLIAPTFFNLGMTLFRQKRYQESLDMFQRANEIMPGDPEYLDLIGNAYMELGRLPEAKDALVAALAADDTYALAHYDMGVVLSRMKGEEEAAMKSFERAVELDPALFWAYYSIGCLYALRGEKKLALQNLDEAFRKGFEDMQHFENDTDWEGLRGDPHFQELVRRYAPGK